MSVRMCAVGWFLFVERCFGMMLKFYGLDLQPSCRRISQRWHPNKYICLHCSLFCARCPAAVTDVISFSRQKFLMSSSHFLSGLPLGLEPWIFPPAVFLDSDCLSFLKCDQSIWAFWFGLWILSPYHAYGSLACPLSWCFVFCPTLSLPGSFSGRPFQILWVSVHRISLMSMSLPRM